MTGVLKRERRGKPDAHREEGHVKTEAEIRVMLPQAKEHQEMPGATRSWKREGKIRP